MIINSISLRNFKSYGNNLQKVTFPKQGSLILLTGQNGNGKCLSSETNVEIEILDEGVKTLFLQFLESRNNPL